MGNDSSKHSRIALTRPVVDALLRSTPFDAVALDILFAKFTLVSRNASSIPRKEFFRYFKGCGEKVIVCFWSAAVSQQSATSFDFLDFTRFAARFGRERPVPRKTMARLAYALFDLGGQENVSRDDMIRVLLSLPKAGGLCASVAAACDMERCRAAVDAFWLAAPLKIVSCAEFAAALERLEDSHRELISSAFGLAPVFLDAMCPLSTNRLLAEPTKRRAFVRDAAIGSKRFVIQEADVTLYEYKRATDAEPSKYAELFACEIERAAQSTSIIVASSSNSSSKRIKLETPNLAEFHEWADAILSNRSSELHGAIIKGDVSLVSTLLARSDVTEQLVKQNITGLTPLHLAIRLDAARDKGEDSAYAFPNQIDEVLDLLLDATKLHDGVGANVADSNGWVPLHIAAQSSPDHIIKRLLLLPHMNVNVRNSDGSTPLHYYCHYARTPECKSTLNLFANHGADINATNKYGETLLHKAVFNSHVRRLIMDWLFRSGCNVDAQTEVVGNKGQDTALHYAVHLQRPDLVRQLLYAGASVSLADAKGITPLRLAALTNLPEIAYMLKAARRLFKYLSHPKLQMGHLAKVFLSQEVYLEMLPDVPGGERGFERLGVRSRVERRRLVKAMPYLKTQLIAKGVVAPDAKKGTSLDSATAPVLRNKQQRQRHIKQQQQELAAKVEAQRNNNSLENSNTGSVGKPKGFVASGDLLDDSGNDTSLPNVSAQTTPSVDLDEMEALSSQLHATAKDSGAELHKFSRSEIEYTEEVGTGTSGTVYKGLIKRVGETEHTPAAIKILKASTTAREREEFMREFKILAAVQGKYLVKFYGWQEQPSLSMVMELCDNGSLYDVLTRKRLMINWGHILDWAYQSALGIYTLHGRKVPIVHRDLKSLNLLMTGDYQVRVCDFGLSRTSTESNMETLGKLRGTMAYCAPEAYLGEQFKASADIYSFGIILWEMTTRIVKQKYERPFQEYPHLVMDFQIIIQVAKAKLRPTIPPTTPPALAKLIGECLQQLPGDRPDVKDVADRLKAIHAEHDANTDVWNEAIVGTMEESSESSSDSSSGSSTSSSSSGSSSSSSSSSSSDSDGTSSDDDEGESVTGPTAVETVSEARLGDLPVEQNDNDLSTMETAGGTPLLRSLETDEAVNIAEASEKNTNQARREKVVEESDEESDDESDEGPLGATIRGAVMPSGPPKPAV